MRGLFEKFDVCSAQQIFVEQTKIQNCSFFPYEKSVEIFNVIANKLFKCLNSI